jgi:thymidylate kinase
MAWILLEGLDRSGKSSVAKHYESKGYKVVHMSAPDKKYFREDYSGESYLEEVVRMYSMYDGQNVVFDRTIYGELIWPNVYGRLSLLNDEDIEYLSMIERNNEAEKILMFDENTEAHWQRCVDNNEPLTRQQFGRANVFYERLAADYGFDKKELPDFPEIGVQKTPRDDSSRERSVGSDVSSSSSDAGDNGTIRSSDENSSLGVSNTDKIFDESLSSSTLGDSQKTIETKLERANAIRSLLQGKIIKKKGEIYDDLDASVREFLQRELDEIFAPKPRTVQCLSDDEVVILKQMAQRVLDKMK